MRRTGLILSGSERFGRGERLRMLESELQREIMKAVTDAGGRVFRNQVGMGWYGHMVQSDAKEGHTIVLTGARPLYAGLCEGSSDLIGWYRGRFLAIEVKAAKGRATQEQVNFIENVNRDGGIGIIARSVDEVLDTLKKSV